MTYQIDIYLDFFNFNIVRISNSEIFNDTSIAVHSNF